MDDGYAAVSYGEQTAVLHEYHRNVAVQSLAMFFFFFLVWKRLDILDTVSDRYEVSKLIRSIAPESGCPFVIHTNDIVKP